MYTAFRIDEIIKKRILESLKRKTYRKGRSSVRKSNYIAEPKKERLKTGILSLIQLFLVVISIAFTF